MASPAAVLSILVEANTKAANASLAKTDAQLRGTAAAATATSGATSKTGTALRKMGTAAKWAGLAVGAAFVIEAKKAVTTTQDLTKSTISLHKNLGLSNKQASEWAGVAKARGVDTTKLGMAFKTLSTQIVAARDGSATSILMFKRLGLSQQEIQRASVDTSFAVKAVADGLNNLKGGADKTAIAGKLFGRGWQTIAPVLRDGSKAMQDQLDLVQKYGGVLEGKTLKQQEELLANIRENKIAWQGFQVELAKFVTPALNAVSDQFQRIAAINADPKLTDTKKWEKISKILDQDFRKALDVIVKAIPIVASRVGEAAPQIAEALVKGFINANIWGKLLIGTWLIKKFGGWGAISALGTRIGTRLGGGIAAGTAAGAEGGAAAGAAGRASTLSRIGRAIPIIGAAAIGADALDKSLQRLDPDSKALANLAQGFDALGDSTKDFAKATPADIRKFTESLQAARETGLHVTGSLGDAIDALKHHYGSFAVAGRNLSKDQRNAWIDMAQSARDNGDITQKQLRQLTNAFTDVGQKNRRMWRDASKATGESVKSIKRSVGDMTIKVGKDVAGPKGMVEVVGGGVDLLAQNLNRSLGSLGVAKSKFMVSSTAHPGHGQAGTRNFQRGGLIPGRGDGDKVPVMAEPGEGFINKRAVRALGGKQVVEAINKAVPRFAGGGVTGDTPGLRPAFLGALGRMAGATHRSINVLSGYRSRAEQAALYARYLAGTGNLAAPPGSSHHELGIAADISPGREVFGGMAGKFGMGFTVPSESWHIELLNAAAAGKFGAGPQKIARVLLKGPPGALRDMGQAALDKTRNAANRYLAKQFRGSMGSLNFTGAGTIPFRGLEQLWIGARGARGMAPLMAHIAEAESGGNPRAHNPSGATGLWQILGALVPGNLFDPHINALNAVAKFKTQGLSAWDASRSVWGRYAQKGGVVAPYVGSFDKGGQVASTGLGMLHQGETVVPGMQHGGMAPTIPPAFLRMLRRLVHFGPEDRHTRRQEARFLHQASRLHDLRQLNAITKALDKFGVKFTKNERDRLRHLAHEQRHPGLTTEQKERLKVVQRSEEKLKHAAEAQGGMTPAIKRQLKRLQEDERKLLSHRGGLTRDEHREVRQLRRERHQAQAQKEIRERLDLQRELIAEFKQLRQDMKADRRERHEVRVNESVVFRALRNFMGREIGYQYAQARRNVSPGSAVRY